MGDQCINAKPPATPRPTPRLAAPWPIGLRVVVVGRGGGIRRGRERKGEGEIKVEGGKGGKKKKKENKHTIKEGVSRCRDLRHGGSAAAGMVGPVGELCERWGGRTGNKGEGNTVRKMCFSEIFWVFLGCMQEPLAAWPCT